MARKRKKPEYKTLKLTKRIKPPVQKKLPSVTSLLIDTWKHMWRYKKVFFGVVAIYFLLNLVLVKGMTTALDVPGLKEELQQGFGLNGVALSATLLGIIAGSSTSSGSVSEVANTYQTILVIVCSLVFIWLFRQTNESRSKEVKVRQAFYEGMTPLIPFVLLLIVIGVQVIPMIAGVNIFSAVQANGLAVSGVELAVWALLCFLLALLTFYLISSSILSLIIVTLPGMTPMRAYRSAKKVVAFRRWIIMRKLLLFALLLAAVFGVILLLFISIMPILTELAMGLLSALALPLVVGSGYKLYRSLL